MVAGTIVGIVVGILEASEVGRIPEAVLTLVGTDLEGIILGEDIVIEEGIAVAVVDSPVESISLEETVLMGAAGPKGTDLEEAVDPEGTDLEEVVDPEGTNLEEAVDLGGIALKVAADPMEDTVLEVGIALREIGLGEVAVTVPMGTDLEVAVSPKGTGLEVAVSPMGTGLEEDIILEEAVEISFLLVSNITAVDLPSGYFLGVEESMHQ